MSFLYMFDLVIYMNQHMSLPEDKYVIFLKERITLEQYFDDRWLFKLSNDAMGTILSFITNGIFIDSAQ